MIFRTFFCFLRLAFGHGRLGHPQSLEYFFCCLKMSPVTEVLMLGLRTAVSAPLLMKLLFGPRGVVVVGAVGAVEAGGGITRHPAPLAILYFCFFFTH